MSLRCAFLGHAYERVPAKDGWVLHRCRRCKRLDGRPIYRPRPGEGWMPDYNRDWYAAHLDEDRELKGHWRKGDRTRIDYWITGTPEWDGPWFYDRGYRMPQHWRMLGAVESTWIDFGDGLSMLGLVEP